MNQRKIIIFSILALIALAALVLVVFVILGRRTEEPSAGDQEETEEARPAESAELPSSQKTKPKNYSLEVEETAFSFAERFGSYSSDNPFGNLEDLQSLMTPELEKEVQEIIAAGTERQEYYGYDARALSSRFLSFSEDRAVILVSTQRVRYFENQSSKVYYQDIRLELVKQPDGWKVAEAVWQ